MYKVDQVVAAQADADGFVDKRGDERTRERFPAGFQDPFARVRGDEHPEAAALLEDLGVDK